MSFSFFPNVFPRNVNPSWFQADNPGKYYDLWRVSSWLLTCCAYFNKLTLKLFVYKILNVWPLFILTFHSILLFNSWWRTAVNTARTRASVVGRIFNINLIMLEIVLLIYFTMQKLNSIATKDNDILPIGKTNSEVIYFI